MKEIWDLALSPAMLPLTILLAPVALYWLFSLVGAAGHGSHGHHGGGGHGHHHGGGGHHHHVGGGGRNHGAGAHQGHSHGHPNHHEGPAQNQQGSHHFLADVFHSLLRLMNAEEVPLMIPLSIFIVLLWGGAMLGNLWFAAMGGWAGTIIPIAALFIALILTRLLVIPIRPLFRLVQNDAEQELPVVGRSGYVRTASVAPTGGQVVVENRGAPIIVGARIAPDAEPIPRNTKVLVIGRDADTGVYIVRPLNEVLPSV